MNEEKKVGTNVPVISEYADKFFKDGALIEQIKNFRGLVSYLGEEVNIDLSDAEYLLQNNSKINNNIKIKNAMKLLHFFCFVVK